MLKIIQTQKSQSFNSKLKDTGLTLIIRIKKQVNCMTDKSRPTLWTRKQGIEDDLFQFEDQFKCNEKQTSVVPACWLLEELSRELGVPLWVSPSDRTLKMKEFPFGTLEFWARRWVEPTFLGLRRRLKHALHWWNLLRHSVPADSFLSYLQLLMQVTCLSSRKPKSILQRHTKKCKD